MRETTTAGLVAMLVLIAACGGAKKTGKCSSDDQCQDGAYCDTEREVCFLACEKVGCQEHPFCDPNSHACVDECPFECAVSVENATARCEAACGYDCNPGYFDAGGKCDPCNVVDHCGKIGETCEVCAAPENSTVACTGGECVVTCADGHYDAGGSCPVCNVTEHCGDACENCVQKEQVCNDAGTACEDGPRFVNVTDPTILNKPMIKDTYTRLIWQGCAAGLTGGDCTTGAVTRKSWWDAADDDPSGGPDIDYCRTLDWGGNGAGWRLPTLEELELLVDLSRVEPPYIDIEAFPETSTHGYWSSSSTSCPLNPDCAWLFSFADTLTYQQLKSSPYNVRCVRDP